MRNFRSIFIILVLLPFFSLAQNQECNLQADSVKARLYYIVNVLSHDSLRGREAGTVEGHKAALFIEKKFKEIGLTCLLKDSAYLQPFGIVDGIKLSEENLLLINKKPYKLMEDFYPLNISANGTISGEIIRVGYGVKSTENQYDDYEFYLKESSDKELKGKIFAIELGVPPVLKGEKNVGDFDIVSKVNLAVEKGASAIIFIKSDKNIPKPVLDLTRFEQPYSIPIIFADQLAYKTIMDSNNAKADLTVKIEKNTRNAYNVIGFLNNNAKNTIVVGAHYDHLGMGGPTSRYKGEPAIHHGADDNASGVSAMIELARNLKCKDFSELNIIFIAFSGEEKGLLGSNYFTKSKVYPLENIDYMLNLDMVGRIDSINGKLSVIGTGTSSQWNTIIDKTVSSTFEIKKAEQESGGSDHASFYVNDIPVLFFFSGLHDDYHKPSDVIGKINFNGIYYTVQYISKLIDNSKSYGKLPFSKTSTESTNTKRNSSVSLGIMPDPAFDGIGLRVADVTENKPAVKAGVIKGDIILKINEHEIRDIYSYMDAMKNFKAGDNVALIIKRETKEIKINVVL